MESKADRYLFRVRYRRDTHEFGGRIVTGEDGRYKLQMWATSPQQRNILVEVAPLDDRDALWPLFHKACNHRGMELLSYRPDPAGGRDWEPVPGG